MTNSSAAGAAFRMLFLEKAQDAQAGLRMLYNLFASTIRWLEINGINATLSLFPDEYTTLSGPQAGGIQESSMLSSCRVYASRTIAEDNWPKNARILEVGVGGGEHAVSIISRTSPTEYIGIDIDLSQITLTIRPQLNALSQVAKVSLIQANSLDYLAQLVSTGQKFDVIYLDSSHWHHCISSEIEYSRHLLSDGGLIVLNDYTPWFISSMEPCGVQKAANSFLRKYPEFKVAYYAINDCDMAITNVS